MFDSLAWPPTVNLYDSIVPYRNCFFFQTAHVIKFAELHLLHNPCIPSSLHVIVRTCLQKLSALLIIAECIHDKPSTLDSWLLFLNRTPDPSSSASSLFITCFICFVLQAVDRAVDDPFDGSGEETREVNEMRLVVFSG